MRGRTVAFFLIGCLLGFLVAAIVFSNESVRGSIFGTALGPQAAPAYVLANMTDVQDWLNASYPEESDALTAATANLAELTTTENFAQTVQDTQDDLNLVLARAFTALTGRQGPAAVSTPAATPDPLVRNLSDGDVSACIGLDENPYNLDGYALYLYVQVPATQVDNLPASWERLDEPQDDNLFWQRLACQSLQDSSGERSR